MMLPQTAPPKGSAAVVSAENERMADHLRSIAASGGSYWWHQHRFELVRQALAANRQRLLDFGCGSGAFLLWLAARKAPELSLTGYDTAAVTPALLRGSAGGAEIRLLSTWPCAEPAFDCIVAMDVMEHLADDRGALQSMAAALTGDGQLIVTVPAYRFFWSSWDERLGHRRRYNRRQLAHVLREAGLVVERVQPIFAFLTPLACWRRLAPARRDLSVEFPVLPRWLNQLLCWICAGERLALRQVTLPFGTSLLAVARKAPSPATVAAPGGVPRG